MPNDGKQNWSTWVNEVKGGFGPSISRLRRSLFAAPEMTIGVARGGGYVLFSFIEKINYLLTSNDRSLREYQTSTLTIWPRYRRSVNTAMPQFDISRIDLTLRLISSCYRNNGISEHWNAYICCIANLNIYWFEYKTFIQEHMNQSNMLCK